MNRYAPVVIPTFSRFEHFKNCIESLKNNKYADETELYIGIDYPTSSKYVDGNNKIKCYIKTITGFKDIHIYEHTYNMGAVANAYYMINEALKKHPFFILSEDDNVFGQSFLSFMNYGLKVSENDENIIAVCGYAYPFMVKFGEKVIKQDFACPVWGYAMWGERRKRIEKYLKQGNLLRRLDAGDIRAKVKKKSPYNYRLLMSACRSFPPDKCQEYFCVTDLSLSAYMLIENKFALIPNISLVQNRGWDGSGEHCKNYEKKSEMLRNDYQKQKIEKDIINYEDSHIANPTKEMYAMWQKYSYEQEGLMKNIDMWIKNKLYILLGMDRYQYIKKRTRFHRRTK